MRNATGVRHVFAPNYDWSVVYVNDDKVWEGHKCDCDPLLSVTKALGGTYKYYEFTDKDDLRFFEEVLQKNKFSEIVGITKI